MLLPSMPLYESPMSVCTGPKCAVRLYVYADVWRFVGDVTVHDLASPSLVDLIEYDTLGVAALEEAKLTG